MSSEGPDFVAPIVSDGAGTRGASRAAGFFVILGIHLAYASALTFVAVVVMPMLVQKLEEFELQLSLMSRISFAIAHHFIQYWYLDFFLFVMIDAAILAAFVFRPRPSYQLAIIYSLVLFCFSVMLVIFMYVGFLLPMTGVVRSLAVAATGM
ncbi:hypothetical protein LOC68_12970 [Blastopirellula sp. JC732]|uniref:Uncharacterized protein n=1 Tax=Blastopirellula sediminis TaxID=2894196 RepID=A0A9X1SK27_9BACT|nr:hypothetical protein [Blastopirellula sediminis]MCC9607398.1 hypothetical protein [Blastopirellula sediminis]MCC9629309.1 hypothetical protein [Blastopirellula sediminis]